MKTTITHASQFRDAFHAAGRAEQFSYEALGLLFDYFEELDPDMELDVIAICCDYAESTPAEIIDAYGIEYDENEPTDHDAAMAYLEANTSIVGVTSEGAIVYASNF
jgi:hypothetical protein